MLIDIAKTINSFGPEKCRSALLFTHFCTLRRLRLDSAWHPCRISGSDPRIGWSSCWKQRILWVWVKRYLVEHQNMAGSSGFQLPQNGMGFDHPCIIVLFWEHYCQYQFFSIIPLNCFAAIPQLLTSPFAIKKTSVPPNWTIPLTNVSGGALITTRLKDQIDILYQFSECRYPNPNVWGQKPSRSSSNPHVTSKSD